MPQVHPEDGLAVDTIYVLLAGVAGGLVLAMLVLVCCKVCLRKKPGKPERHHARARKYHSLDSAVSVDVETSCGYPDSSPSSRELKEFDPEELIEGGASVQSWQHQEPSSHRPENDIELQELPKSRASVKKGPGPLIPKNGEIQSDSSSPERPPDVTSVVRRRSSVGIQRQASVCLSDEEDTGQFENVADKHKAPKVPQREVTKVAAIVHHSYNDKPLPHKWNQASSSSQPLVGVHHPPFIHSHSSPDPRSTITVLDSKHGKILSAISLHGIPVDTLARVVDLEDYHYSRQQVWELATQGATLLRERSQSSLDVTTDTDGWKVEDTKIQEAASTEAGLLEQGLEEHQLDHLRSLLRRYSPVDEEDAKIWSKVRYNDTGSREDIREEVIEMISGESSDDSNCLVENEIERQKYRELWQLRATLEEQQDKLSDTPEMDDDPAEDCEIDSQFVHASHTTSFESNADVACDDPGYDCDESDYLQLPTHELRRHCYKSLLTKRLQKRGPTDSRSGHGVGIESSFDSVESSSTDRTEGATTSFESTTDNTDSTGEGQTNRLQQMKADSGYKSMESTSKAPRLCRKHLPCTLDGESVDATLTVEGTFEEEVGVSFEETEELSGDYMKTKTATETSKVVSFEIVAKDDEGLPPSEPQVHKKKYKSALKKHCTESDIQCSEPHVITDAATETRGKTSVFQRFFRSGRVRIDHMQQFRDYSIDEKSDALFREFSRPDVADTEYYRSRASRLHGHMRLHHRSLPSSESGSPHLARKVLSPQLSIEEENCETVAEENLLQEKRTRY